jgi:hypothetical protein
MHAKRAFPVIVWSHFFADKRNGFEQREESRLIFQHEQKSDQGS